MGQKFARAPTSRTQELPRSDGDGNLLHNEILLNLPQNEHEIVFPTLEFMRLNGRHLIHEVGDTLKSAYFCNSGIISILSVFPDGKSVEVGLVGQEGFIGLPLIAGFRNAATRAVVQVEATVFRIEAHSLAASLALCPKLERQL